MKRTILKTFAATGAAAMILSGCSLFDRDSETSGDTSGEDSGSDNPVYSDMTSWDACEVLGDLQPITDEMGIQGWGSLTASGGTPETREYGNTFDPDAIGCGNLISLGDSEGYASGGEISVAIVPAESEDQAATVFSERSSSAEGAGSGGQEFMNSELSDPWDEGVLYSWLGDSDAPHTQLIARDGQWILHIEIEHDKDFGAQNTGTPSFPFTEESLAQWLTDTYAPEVNQIVNDRIAEVQ